MSRVRHTTLSNAVPLGWTYNPVWALQVLVHLASSNHTAVQQLKKHVRFRRCLSLDAQTGWCPTCLDSLAGGAGVQQLSTLHGTDTQKQLTRPAVSHAVTVSSG
jgi:hypothetical protein